MATTLIGMNKSVRSEKQPKRSPLRRSDRGKKYSSSSSWGSIQSGKESASSDMKGKRETTEITLKQSTENTSEVIKNENQDMGPAGTRRKVMNDRSYKDFFKLQRRRYTDAGSPPFKHVDNDKGLRRWDKLPQVDRGSNGDVDENVERPDQVPQVDSRHGGGSGSKLLEDKDNTEDELGEIVGSKLAMECIERDEGPIRVADQMEVELSNSNQKLSYMKGQNDPFDKDGTAMSKNRAIVERTVDDTAKVLVDPSKTNLNPPELIDLTSGKALDGGSRTDGSGDSESGDKTLSSNRNIANMNADAYAITDCKGTSKADGISSPLSGARTQDSTETCTACSKTRRGFRTFCQFSISTCAF